MRNFNNILFKLVALILFKPLVFFPQSKSLVQELNQSTDIPCSIGAYRTLSSFSDDKIYFIELSELANAKTFFIHTYNTKTLQKGEDIKITNFKEYKSIKRDYITGFSVNGENIIIIGDDYIYSINFTKNKAYFTDKTKNLKSSFQKVLQLSDSTFLLYLYYNFHPMDAPIKSQWGLWNSKLNKIQNVKQQDDSDASFTHLVNDWVTTYKGQIAHCNSTKYFIGFYDSNFNLIDSISSALIDTNKVHLKKLDLDVQSKESIKKLIRFDDSLLTRIQKIHLVDSITLIVSVKKANFKDLELHVWKKAENKWKLVSNERISSFYENGKSYSDSSLALNPFYGNASNIVTGSDKNLYLIYHQFIPNVITNSFDRQRDFIDKKNELAKRNNFHYGIKKFRLVY
jgi:hypothetical protein